MNRGSNFCLSNNNAWNKIIAAKEWHTFQSLGVRKFFQPMLDLKKSRCLQHQAKDVLWGVQVWRLFETVWCLNKFPLKRDMAMRGDLQTRREREAPLNLMDSHSEVTNFLFSWSWHHAQIRMDAEPHFDPILVSSSHREIWLASGLAVIFVVSLHRFIASRKHNYWQPRANSYAYSEIPLFILFSGEMHLGKLSHLIVMIRDGSISEFAELSSERLNARGFMRSLLPHNQRQRLHKLRVLPPPMLAAARCRVHYGAAALAQQHTLASHFAGKTSRWRSRRRQRHRRHSRRQSSSLATTSFTRKQKVIPQCKHCTGMWSGHFSQKND